MLLKKKTWMMMRMIPLKTWWGLMQLLLEMSLKKIAWRRGGLEKMMLAKMIGLKEKMLM